MSESEEHSALIAAPSVTQTALPNFAQVLAAAQVGAPETLALLMQHVEDRETLPEPIQGREYLLLKFADACCVVPLQELREVLPVLPVVVELPFSPAWLLGIFPLRAEMIGLADPIPFLMSSDARADQTHEHHRALPTAANAILIGEGERSLALTVTDIGDILVAQETEIGANSDAAAADAALFSPRYVTGSYTVAHDARRYPILDLPRVVEDMLRELEREGHARG